MREGEGNGIYLSYMDVCDFLRWSYHEVGISRVRKSEFPLEGRLRLITVVWKWHDFS